MSNKKPYLLDQMPVTARDLCREAAAINSDFKESAFKLTSEAATILRDNGHEVMENPDYV